MTQSRRADVQPFRGLRYGREAGNPQNLLAPPYDVISEDRRRELAGRGLHNVVRIELPEKRPGDGPENNRHARAAAELAAWRGRSVLQLEPAPALYFYEQTFQLEGRPRRRRSFFARVRLAGPGTIKPHELTHKGPREDRMEMLRRLRTQVSPVFGMYRSAKGIETPDGDVDFEAEVDGETHRLWALTDASDIARVLASVDGPLYIADGHHRYASAMAYRDERRAAASSWSGEEPENFVMMGLAPTAELVVLGTHRLVTKAPPADLAERLAHYFSISPCDRAAIPAALIKARVAGTPVFGVVGLTQEHAHLLMVTDDAAIRRVMPVERSAPWRALDVAMLQEVVLARCLGLDGHAAERDELRYTADDRAAMEAVGNDGVRLSFLVNPTPVEQVLAVADAGDHMPQKSTYFYPKLPTGLVLYPHA